MINFLYLYFIQLGLKAWLSLTLSWGLTVVLLVSLSFMTQWVMRRYLLRFFKFMAQKKESQWLQILAEHRLFLWLTRLIPILVLFVLWPLLAASDQAAFDRWVVLLHLLIVQYFIFVLVMFLHEALNCIDQIYAQFPIAKLRPIRTYLQVIRLLFIGLAIISSIAILVGRSPAALLTGLGAMTAILSLVFKDSIMGFVTSIQLTSYDMVRVGDWIEMPKYGADGDVVDISLNTIKVQNFDKTIVTIPTHMLMTEGVKNWRGMQEAGGRRIKRCFYIDMHSICFCDEQMLERLLKIHQISGYLQEKQLQLQQYNTENNIDSSTTVNGRRLTNVGTLRAYLQAYLSSHPDVHPGLTLLVRQLQPTDKGLPIELYIFTNDTNWLRYEAIQADIFDHVLAILPEFGLKVYQSI